MNTSDNLMAGYATYTSADEIAATLDGGAPEISPVSLSIAVSITESSYACGAGISLSVGWTVGKGC
ncbi:LxmA leader domain family RiPP [Streptomyces sp. NRRL F-5650]|uniref:LxmA leader domain family RiPP n=1 Tax=Streptomyces sp. NRRL F-5650 TaxID=1463868 RepID=UPI0004C5AA5D|nr:LxmA leader domain family RiPP [Streptomyces sp. NRRL F-5650]